MDKIEITPVDLSGMDKIEITPVELSSEIQVKAWEYSGWGAELEKAFDEVMHIAEQIAVQKMELLEWMENLFGKSWAINIRKCNSRRVIYLALHSKKKRVRNKNLSRMFNNLVKFNAKEESKK